MGTLLLTLRSNSRDKPVAGNESPPPADVECSARRAVPARESDFRRDPVYKSRLLHTVGRRGRRGDHDCGSRCGFRCHLCCRRSRRALGCPAAAERRTPRDADRGVDARLAADRRAARGAARPGRRHDHLGPTISATLELGEVLQRTLAATHAIKESTAAAFTCVDPDGTVTSATLGIVVDSGQRAASKALPTATPFTLRDRLLARLRH